MSIYSIFVMLENGRLKRASMWRDTTCPMKRAAVLVSKLGWSTIGLDSSGGTGPLGR